MAGRRSTLNSIPAADLASSDSDTGSLMQARSVRERANIIITRPGASQAQVMNGDGRPSSL